MNFLSGLHAGLTGLPYFRPFYKLCFQIVTGTRFRVTVGSPATGKEIPLAARDIP